MQGKKVVSSMVILEMQAAWNLPSTIASTVTVVQICIPLVILLRCSLVLWMQCTLLPAPELLPCKEARGSQEVYSGRCVRIYLELSSSERSSLNLGSFLNCSRKASRFRSLSNCPHVDSNNWKMEDILRVTILH